MEYPNDTLTSAALGLAIGFPVTELLLSEAIQFLRQQGRPLSGTLQIVRNLLIPALAGLIFLTYILNLNPESWQVRFIETVLWICTLVASLSLFDILLFSESDDARQARARRNSDLEADSERWQARIPKLFRDLARAFLILVGAAIILSATWDIDLGGLVAALGVGSVVIGLALQDTLGSIAAGIALLFEQPFKKGDWLKVGVSEGKVTDINWRAVRIETIDNVQINIPHLIIGKETITNYSQPLKAHEEEIFLRYAYRHPPNLVKQVLKATALATPGILTDPEVEVSTVKYEDSGIAYRVSFYIDGFQNRIRIRDEYHTRVWYANQRYSLRIPHPIREIYQIESPSQQLVQDEKVAQGLQAMPVLVDMAADSFADLTKEAILNTFAAGEEVFAEGDNVQALYLILAGRAEAYVRDSSGKQQQAYSMSRGDFFGEISLFSGKPSAVTIRASEDLEVMLIVSDIAQALVERKPSLARELGVTIEKRTRLIETTRQTATAPS